MLHTSYEIDLMVDARRQDLADEAGHRHELNLATAGRPASIGGVRRALGNGLIALGERLAGRSSGRATGSVSSRGAASAAA